MKKNAPEPYIDGEGDAMWITTHSTTGTYGLMTEYTTLTSVNVFRDEPGLLVSTALAELSMTPDEARSIAQALLAAADYEEEKER